MPLGRKALTIPISAALCAACAQLPDRAELQVRGAARIQVQSLAPWHLSAPADGGYDLQISHLDGKGLCRGGGCVGTLEVPAGHHSLVLLCMLVSGGLRIPKLSMDYQGDFAAGHVYGIRPASATPDCRVTLEDISARSP
jgi:hypothetical protein